MDQRLIGAVEAGGTKFVLALAREDGTVLARETADLHLAAALPHVAGDYMGEHWLASFALLALEAGG